MREFIATYPVHMVTNHQCMFGLRARGTDGSEGPAKKPTTWLTNAACIAEALDVQCDGNHQHVALFGGNRTCKAQVYPEGIGEAILKGLKRQVIADLNMFQARLPESNNGGHWGRPPGETNETGALVWRDNPACDTNLLVSDLPQHAYLIS